MSALTVDLAEWLAASVPALRALAAPPASPRVAFHPPCTLQHGQRVRGQAEAILEALGAELAPVRDAHLCCGSAGPYALLEAGIATALRTRKLEGILAGGPGTILSANIGCLVHLAAGTAVPVRHWIEWVDDLLEARRAAEGGAG